MLTRAAWDFKLTELAKKCLLSFYFVAAAVAAVIAVVVKFSLVENTFYFIQLSADMVGWVT